MSSFFINGISIIIPSYNQGSLLKNCIVSLNNQKTAVAFEIIVVDDGSKDDTENIIKNLKIKNELRLYCQEHKGPAAARNTGISLAKYDLIAFTDADCKPRDDWLQQIYCVFTENKADCVGGPLIDSTFTNNKRRNILHEFMLARSPERNEEPFYFMNKYLGLSTANMIVRKEILNKINGFNEEFKVPGGEDFEFSSRVQSNGFNITFNLKILVEHYYPSNLRSLIRRFINYGRGKTIFSIVHQIPVEESNIICDRFLHLITRFHRIVSFSQHHFNTKKNGIKYYATSIIVELLFQLGAILEIRNRKD